LLEQIRKNLVKRVLDSLEEMKNSEYDKYVAFFQELGAVLKEGVSRDWTNRQKVADLLLFESMKAEKGKYVTLQQYVDAMPPEQKEIYYLIGESRELLEHSPYLEAFRSRGQDVLLLTDPIDEFMLPSLHEYKGKKLQGADRGELPAEQKTEDEGFKKLFEYLKSKLPEVSAVRLSNRLKESAACLVTGEGEVSAHMERLMQRLGRGEEVGDAKRVLELNGEHPAVVALRELYEKTPDDPRVEQYARLFYDQAVIAEGSKVKDPTAFARRINELLVKDAKA
jgi:molecular chaperone HtpG